MGIDPTDGGDARRSFFVQADGTVAMIGCDTLFTLCDNTDRGIGRFTIVETASRQDGTPVSVILLHRTAAQ